jgi:hypothetical protein
MYDTLKSIMQGRGSTDNIPPIIDDLHDISSHMLRFLENHDEQRIASPEFAGDAQKGKPAMVVSATVSDAPVMIYFGQEVGEPASEDAGFGTHSRTTIFDYFGVPHHQRWMNNGLFDGALLTQEERELRDFYKRLLNFTINSKALTGEYFDLHRINRSNSDNYTSRQFSFARFGGDEKLIVISNFDAHSPCDFKLVVPRELIKIWNLADGNYPLVDMLYGLESSLVVNDGVGEVAVLAAPLESFVFAIAK